MTSLRVLSAAEQVAEHLRTEITRGIWRGIMPGGGRLAKELGIGNNTIEAALGLLEDQGLLVSQGSRRRRVIKTPSNLSSTSMRVAILCLDRSDHSQDSIIEVKHELSEAGHTPFYATKTLKDFDMDVKRIADYVDKTEADAWVVIAGSREILEWFAAQPLASFALFGRRRNVNIAGTGPHSSPAIACAVHRLAELGHQRIVMLSRKEKREPKPAQFESAFLAELENQRLSVGPYNLPDWQESKYGLHQLLDSLFQLTPPTAIIMNEAPHFIALLNYLAEKGIRHPKNISIICTNPNRVFSWCEPTISHITWDISKAARYVVQWANNINLLKDDLLQTHIKGEFVEGGTVGPAKE